MTYTSEKVLVRAKRVRETPNTLRFQEINDRGQLLDLSDSLIGTIYIKKSNFPSGQWPNIIQISVVTVE